MNLNECSCVRGYHVYQDTWTPVISEQLVCRREDSNPREFFLHSLKYLYNTILQLIIKRKLFHWKSFAVTNYSVKTAKLFHLEQFAIYGIHYIHLTLIYTVEDCTVSKITGNVKQNKQNKRTVFEFSADNSNVTYMCKVDEDDLRNCK